MFCLPAPGCRNACAAARMIEKDELLNGTGIELATFSPQHRTVRVLGRHSVRTCPPRVPCRAAGYWLQESAGRPASYSINVGKTIMGGLTHEIPGMKIRKEYVWG